MRASILFLATCLLAAHAQEPAAANTVPPTSEERIQELESRIISLERTLAALSDYLLRVDGCYVLKAGDSGARVAALFEPTLSDLQSLNPEINWSRLKVGQIVRVKERARPDAHKK